MLGGRSMAQLIHLASAEDRNALRKGGIKPSRLRSGGRAVYAFPQTEDFVVNHQWMRELKRRTFIRMLAVRFRIPDGETVSIGKYNAEHIDVTAAEAIAIARSHDDPMGLEVLVPRAIRPKEIISFYTPPKVSGWRYYPEAKGRKPCACPYCQRGEPFSRKIRESYDE